MDFYGIMLVSTVPSRDLKWFEMLEVKHYGGNVLVVEI